MSNFELAKKELTTLMFLINIKNPNKLVELELNTYPNSGIISVYFNSKTKVSDFTKWQSVFNLVVKTAKKHGLELTKTGSFNCLVNFQA